MFTQDVKNEYNRRVEQYPQAADNTAIKPPSGSSSVSSKAPVALRKSSNAVPTAAGSKMPDGLNLQSLFQKPQKIGAAAGIGGGIGAAGIAGMSGLSPNPRADNALEMGGNEDLLSYRQKNGIGGNKGSLSDKLSSFDSA